MAKNTYLVLGVAALTAGAVMLLSRRAAAALPNGPVASPTPSPAPAPPPSAALPPPIYLPPSPRPAPTPTPAPTDICTFLRDPQNAQVFFAQVKLYRMGLINVQADGRLNSATVSALRTFQSAGGWPVTGTLDAQTLASIDSDFSDRSRGVEGTLPLRPYPYTLPSC